MHRAARHLLLPLLLALALGACAERVADLPADDGEAVAVLPGKADDYLSPTSREYRLWGIGDVTLDDSWRDADAEAREARVRELLGYRFKAYGHFINEYITDKGHHDENREYGGFAGLIRTTSLDWITEPVDEAQMTWTFIWEFEMGGPRGLLEDLPVEPRDDGSLAFGVTMPILDEGALERDSYPKAFDPETYEGELEEIEVAVEPIEESFDAWPEYHRLFADDRLDVLILVGGDYNDKRYDLLSAEEIFDWLKAEGYEHPAEAYTELTLESEPFRGEMQVEGRAVAIEITLLHPDIVPDEELDRLRERIVEAYATLDLVIYDGHAGQDPDYSGVVYHYKPRHAIKANDFAGLTLPDKYQIYVFNGCKTYNAYPEAVFKNPAKTTDNLDIISTVNFSWLSQQTFTTREFLYELLATRGGQHDPRTYVEVLSAINERSNWNVYYGVHGLDDNPHLNPYADPDSLCMACGGDDECPGAGNRCVRLDEERVCGVECTTDDGCPPSHACVDVAVGSQITGGQCLPTTYRCE